MQLYQYFIALTSLKIQWSIEAVKLKGLSNLMVLKTIGLNLKSIEPKTYWESLILFIFSPLKFF